MESPLEQVPAASGTGIPDSVRGFFLQKKLWAVALLLAAGLAVGIWFFAGASAAPDRAVLVNKVQELSTLVTAKAYVKTVIEKEDNKLFGKDISFDLPGTKRKLLLVIPATVLAGVDLKQVSAQDIKLNEETKELTLTLPHASIIDDPSIDMDRVQTFSAVGMLRRPADAKEGFDLAAEAQQQIKQEAADMGLLGTADVTAENVLKTFFGELGYRVEVKYK